MSRTSLYSKKSKRQKLVYLDDSCEHEEQPVKKSKPRPRYRQEEEVFKCRHCRQFVGLLPSGGSHRNHCPYCLYSRHVDSSCSGDRLSDCGTSMEPIGRFARPNGEEVVVHRCLGCDQERFNRIGADDDYELFLRLPQVAARSRREVKAQALAAVLSEEYTLDSIFWDEEAG